MKKTERSKPSAGRTSRASYRRHPMSLVQRIAVTASAVITFAILAALLAYILIMGVPNLKSSLFAWHYTSDNCSMTPAIINTLLMVVLSLLLSVPFGIGAAILAGALIIALMVVPMSPAALKPIEWAITIAWIAIGFVILGITGKKQSA